MILAFMPALLACQRAPAARPEHSGACCHCVAMLRSVVCAEFSRAASARAAVQTAVSQLSPLLQGNQRVLIGVFFLVYAPFSCSFSLCSPVGEFVGSAGATACLKCDVVLVHVPMVRPFRCVVGHVSKHNTIEQLHELFHWRVRRFTRAAVLYTM